MQRLGPPATLSCASHSMDGQTLAPGLVKKILVKDVGLTEDAALVLIRG